MRTAKYKGENTKIGQGSNQSQGQSNGHNLSWLNQVGTHAEGDFPISLQSKVLRHELNVSELALSQLSFVVSIRVSVFSSTRSFIALTVTQAFFSFSF